VSTPFLPKVASLLNRRSERSPVVLVLISWISWVWEALALTWQARSGKDGTGRRNVGRPRPCPGRTDCPVASTEHIGKQLLRPGSESSEPQEPTSTKTTLTSILWQATSSQQPDQQANNHSRKRTRDISGSLACRSYSDSKREVILALNWHAELSFDVITIKVHINGGNNVQ